MAPRTGELQGLAKDAVVEFFGKRIAAAIYQSDRRDCAASLDQLDPLIRKEYEQQGRLVALLSDDAAMRAACYAAADAMIAGGIDRLTQPQRACAVALFIKAFKAMKASFMGTAHPDTQALMQALVERDRAAGINAQPVNTKPLSSINLSELETAPEVH